MHTISQILKFLEILNQKYGTLLFYTGLVLLILDIHWFWIDDMPKSLVSLARFTLILPVYLFSLRLLLLAPKYPCYFIGCLIILFVLGISHLNSNSSYLYLTGFAIAASRDSNYTIVLRSYLIVFLVILLAIPIFHSLGWTEDIVKHSMGLVGHSWGLYNPNRLGGFLTYLLFLFFLVKDRTSTKQILFFCLVGAIIIMLSTMSITSTLLLVLFPLLLQINQRYIINSRCWLFLPTLCFALSVGLALFFGLPEEESTFASRFSIPYLFYKQDGLSWFGQVLSSHVSWRESFATGKSALYINNMYLRVILQQGILAWLIFLGFLSAISYRVGCYGSPILKAITLCTLLYGIMQSFPLYIRFDYLLLSFFWLEEKQSEQKTTIKDSPVVS